MVAHKNQLDDQPCLDIQQVTNYPHPIANPRASSKNLVDWRSDECTQLQLLLTNAIKLPEMGRNADISPKPCITRGSIAGDRTVKEHTHPQLHTDDAEADQKTSRASSDETTTECDEKS
jgi:hypothetical protein